MTRKDFVLIAATIRASNLALGSKRHIANLFIGALAATNPNFKPDTFMAAAMGEGNNGKETK